MTAVFSLSVVFLTFERIVYVSVLTNYHKSAVQKRVTITAVFLPSYLFHRQFHSILHGIAISGVDQKLCHILVLIDETGAVFFTYSKMLAGALNFFGGIIFLYKFWKPKSFYSNDQTMSSDRDRRTNRVAIVVITLEIVLNFIPQLGAALVYQIFGIVAGTYIGPYNFTLTATDAIISSSLIYSTSFKSKHKTQVVQMSSGNRLQSTT